MLSNVVKIRPVLQTGEEKFGIYVGNALERHSGHVAEAFSFPSKQYFESAEEISLVQRAKLMQYFICYTFIH